MPRGDEVPGLLRPPETKAYRLGALAYGLNCFLVLAPAHPPPPWPLVLYLVASQDIGAVLRSAGLDLFATMDDLVAER